MSLPLRQLAGRVFADLGRARITPRQALIYERLIRVTLARGRQAVRVPRLEMFGRFKLTRGNVADALNGSTVDGRRVPGLVELGMLQAVPAVDGGLVLTLLPDATQWRCEWRFARADDAAFLADLDAVANQVQGELLPAEKGLPEALAEVSAEAACSRFGNGPARLVPDSGTPLRDSEFRSSKPCTKLSTPELLKGERELMDQCRELFGEKPMVNWGGAWRNRARQDPGKLRRVLAETAGEMKARTISNPSGYANDLWKRFR